MPFKKKFYRKKRSYGKKRFGWKKRKSQRAARKGKKVYYFTRIADAGSILSDNANEVYLPMSFSLDQVPAYAEYTNLFDEYKVSAVKVSFVSTAMTTITQQSGVQPAYTMPLLYTALDYNDASGTYSIQDLREYQTCRYHTLQTKINTRYFKPCFQTLVYEGLGQGYSPKRGWLNTDDYSVQHYALKVALEPTGGALDYHYEIKVMVKYYLAFRNSK